MNKKNRNRIGLEITEQELRATHIVKTSHLPLAVGVIVPIQTTVEEALHQLQQKLNCQRGSVTLAVDYEKVICKNILLESSLSDIEMFTYIQNQALKLFGLPNEAIHFDYHLLPHASPYTWQIVAAKKIDIEEKVNLSRQVGFSIKAIDVNFLSLIRLYHYLHEALDETIVIMIIEPSRLQFCVLNQHQFLYHSAALLLTTQDCHYEQNLLDTINQSFKRFQQSSAQLLQAIYLIGDIVLLSKISPRIELATQIKTEVAQCLSSRIQISKFFDSRLLISLALGLWGN